MPTFGFMLVAWSRASDLCGKIWCYIGFIVIFLLLQRLELKTTEKATVSSNKVVARGHPSWWIRGARMLLLDGHGGEGKERSGASSSASQGLHVWFLLQDGVNHMVAVFAVVICGQSGGPSKHRLGVSSTSRMDAPSIASRRSSTSSRHQVVRPRRCQGGRWSRLVPGGEDKGLIAFLVFISRSFAQMFRTML
jgi:hypothetical protein